MHEHVHEPARERVEKHSLKAVRARQLASKLLPHGRLVRHEPAIMHGLVAQRDDGLLRGELAAEHRIVDALTAERIDQGRRIAYQHPSAARDGAPLASTRQLPALEAPVDLLCAGEPIAKPRMRCEQAIRYLLQLNFRGAVVAHEKAFHHSGPDVGEPVTCGEDPKVAGHEIRDEMNLDPITEAGDASVVDAKCTYPVLVLSLVEVIRADDFGYPAQRAGGSDDDGHAQDVLAPVGVPRDDARYPVVLPKDIDAVQAVESGDVGLPFRVLKEQVVESRPGDHVGPTGGRMMIAVAARTRALRRNERKLEPVAS